MKINNSKCNKISFSSIKRNHEEIKMEFKHSIFNALSQSGISSAYEERIMKNTNNKTDSYHRNLKEFQKRLHKPNQTLLKSGSNKVLLPQVTSYNGGNNLKQKILNQIIISNLYYKNCNIKLEKMDKYLFHFRLFTNISDNFSREIIDMVLINDSFTNLIKGIEKLKFTKGARASENKYKYIRNIFIKPKLHILKDTKFIDEVAVELPVHEEYSLRPCLLNVDDIYENASFELIRPNVADFSLFSLRIFVSSTVKNSLAQTFEKSPKKKPLENVKVPKNIKGSNLKSILESPLDNEIRSDSLKFSFYSDSMTKTYHFRQSRNIIEILERMASIRKA